MVNFKLMNLNMMVITDQTAGIDSVGTSMFCASEINLFVVEPTMKSIGIIKDFENVTKNYNLKNYVIINKALDESDVEFVKRELGEEKVIGVIAYSSNIRRYEQGDKEKFNLFIEENKEVFEKILNLVKNTKKDWKQYKERLYDIYKKNCETWYSEYYGVDLLRIYK